MMVSEEISMIVSSDPNQGAINVSADGSYFEVQLQDGLKIPKEAQSVSMQVDEATVWWTTPNIITGQNDKMYITGASAPSSTNNVELGFGNNVLVGNNGSTLTMTDSTNSMPLGVFLVGDFFQYDNAPTSTGTPFQISAITTDTVSSKRYTLSSAPPTLLPATYNFSRIRNGGVITNYVITLPQGLYDLPGFNTAVSTALDNLNAQSSPQPLVSFIPNNATQRVQLIVNYPDTYVDFRPAQTPYIVLGFDRLKYGPYNSANGLYTSIPNTIEAPNTAQFNQVNYFLVHSDLTSRGIRINNSYDQVIATVLIDVPPGSQIVSRPFNPPKVSLPELAGSIKTYLRFWLTDDSNRRVYTNGELWSARIVIRYNVPYVIGVSK